MKVVLVFALLAAVCVYAQDAVEETNVEKEASLCKGESVIDKFSCAIHCKVTGQRGNCLNGECVCSKIASRSECNAMSCDMDCQAWGSSGGNCFNGECTCYGF